MADANVSVSFSASTGDFVSQVSQAKDALQTFAASGVGFSGPRSGRQSG